MIKIPTNIYRDDALNCLVVMESSIQQRVPSQQVEDAQRVQSSERSGLDCTCGNSREKFSHEIDFLFKILFKQAQNHPF